MDIFREKYLWPVQIDSDISICPETNGIEPSLSNLETLQNDSSHLHQLVLEGNLLGVRDFLANIASKSGTSLLHSLLEEQNADGQTALHLACRRGSSDLVNTILEYKEANVNVLDKDGDPPLVFALAAGSPDCVRALIEKNASQIQEEGWLQSVRCACLCLPWPTRLHASADPNTVDDEGEYVLHKAVTKNIQLAPSLYWNLVASNQWELLIRRI